MRLIAKKPGYTPKAEDSISIFITEENVKRIESVVPAHLGFITEIASLSYFKGKRSETLFLPLSARPNVILCGIGKTDDLSPDALRTAAAAVTGLCREKKISDIHLIMPEVKTIDATTVLSSIAEGLYLSNYSFDKYKGRSKDDMRPLVQKAFLITDAASSAKLLKDIETVSRNTHLCRDLINEISDTSNAQGIAAEAKKLSSLPGVTCRVFGKKELQKMKMGLILAVNRGSSRPPQLVVLKYTGNSKSKRFVAVIGKGITFDSGGMNLKPTGHVEDMRTDMAGSAAALYTLKSAAELKLKINLYAVLPLTDNMLSNDSYRPGDVFKSYSGLTVEIGNTDAEGRLVLADAIAYTEKVLKPKYIIDIATLTGACLVTFGEIVAAYMTNDEELGDIFKSASSSTGEKIWQLPLLQDYEENMKSDMADINNISSEKNAGTIMGGIFLKNFVKKVKWLHLDIAGTARFSKPRGYIPKHATGFGVRLITEALRNLKV